MSTGGDDKDEAKDAIPLRTRLSDLKHRLESPIESREALFDLLLAPLDLLQIVPTDLPIPFAKYASWKDCNHEDRRKAHTDHAWISNVQRLLLEKVMVDWEDELREMPWLLEAWFAPNFVSRDDGEGRKNTSEARVGTIYIATLSTLTAILSSASIKQVSTSVPSSSRTPLDLALPRESVSLLDKILVLFAKRLSLVGIVNSLQEYQTTSKRDIIWTSIVRELTSLPERVANAQNGKVPLELERRHFITLLGAQVDDLIHSACPPDLTAILLTKLLRNGYFEETSTYQEEPTNMWPAFLRKQINRNKQDQGASSWPHAMQSLSMSTRSGIILSLVSFIDKYSLQRGGASALMNGNEAVKPGTEGQQFLRSNTWSSLLIIAATIEPLLVVAPSSRIKHGDEEDSDSETEVVKVYSSLLEICILPSSNGYWSPLTARLLMHICCRRLSEKECLRILSRAIDLWSSTPRIKTALLQQEEYLITVILILLAQLPSTSISTLCTSSPFISGVSAHLQHLSPQIRRMGMLVAEVVSTASSGEKALSFGKVMWDGKGEGKEEARVLRAMYHDWSSREQKIAELDEQEILSAFGLAIKLEVAVKNDTLLIKKERQPPIIRALPAKRSAPSRKKTLIQSIDGEDLLEEKVSQDEDSLPLLTNIQSKRDLSSNNQQRAYISDEEVSSSSESDSSDSEIEGGSNRSKTAGEKQEEFGLGMPQKKKRRNPIYIHELAPLFREQEREANKLALKHAESLIRKKSGWGGEIDENAIDLAIAILSLQNNFNFKLFEEKKKSIMTSLVCASPRLVAPCLAEQYFNQQYSMTQRICILNSLAFGARQLSVTGKQGDNESSLKTLAEGFSHMAIIRSRVEGGKRFTQKHSEEEKSLLINQSTAPNSLDAGMSSKSKTVSMSSNIYLDLAGPSFIFPLINRFWAHLNHASVTRSNRYKGSGSTILFDSFLLCAFLDTLAILCYCAQNAVNFSSDIVPEVINLSLTITNSTLGRIDSLHHDKNTWSDDSQGGGAMSILGASANLFLLLMDAVHEVDSGRTLLNRHRNLIQQVEMWAQAVFESVDGDSETSRAARCSAALLVRIHEIKMGLS